MLLNPTEAESVQPGTAQLPSSTTASSRKLSAAELMQPYGGGEGGGGEGDGGSKGNGGDGGDGVDGGSGGDEGGGLQHVPCQERVYPETSDSGCSAALFAMSWQV